MLRSHGCERAAMLRTSGGCCCYMAVPRHTWLHGMSTSLCVDVKEQRAFPLAVIELNKLSVYRIHIIFFCHTVKVSSLFSAICIIPSGHPITIRSRICLH